MLFPFLFNVYKDDDLKEYDYSVVKIAYFDMALVFVGWMHDDRLPEGRTLKPEVNIVVESHKFDTELAAIEFIKQWWIKKG